MLRLCTAGRYHLAMTTSTRNSMDPDKLHLYHDNPNLGDVPTIKESLLENDQFRPIVVNLGTLTGRPHEVLAGNHTVMAIRELREENPEDARWQRVLIHTVDVDDVRAAKIVLADNRTGELGQRDDESVLRLLEALGADDLTGTGYDADAMKYLTDALNPPDLSEFPDYNETTADTGGSKSPVSRVVECPECGHTFDPSQSLPKTAAAAGDR